MEYWVDITGRKHQGSCTGGIISLNDFINYYFSTASQRRIEMKKSNLWILYLGLSALLLGGCGSSLKIIKPVESGAIPEDASKTFEVASVTGMTDANVPSDIIQLVENSIREEIRRVGIASNTGNLLINVEVTGYRQRDTFVRVFFGALAGSDWVEAQVQVIDRESKKIIGEASVRGSNATVVDFSFTISLLGKKVADYLKNL